MKPKTGEIFACSEWAYQILVRLQPASRAAFSEQNHGSPLNQLIDVPS